LAAFTDDDAVNRVALLAAQGNEAESKCCARSS
jgi:hypothetical protein